MKKPSIRFLVCCFYLLSKLPFGKVQGMGRFVGRCCLKYDKRTVRDIDTNLSLCFPEKSKPEREKIRNARLEYLGQVAFELSHIWVKDLHQLHSYLKPTHDNCLFETALRGDEGVIFLFPHLGNWEVMSCYLSQFKSPILMYSPQKKSKELDTFICDARRRVGANLAPANIKGITQMIKSLKEGGLVGILPDQVPQDGGGVYCPFYNHQAYTMTLAYRLAKKTNAKVFIGAAFSSEAGFEILAEPISEAFYDDLEVSTKVMNRSIEKLISYRPEQYQWEYKRFRKQQDKQRFYTKVKG